MNSKLYNIVKIVVAAIALIGIALFIMVAMKSKDDVVGISDATHPLITFSIALVILTIIITVLFSIRGLFTTPGALKQALISLVVLGGLFVLAYALANDAEVTNTYGQALKDNAGAAGIIPKRVGAMINYTYILGAIALATIAWGGLKGMFSK
ncbi:MAG: hypothetical protein COA67_02220 [Lutibacter sp.]|nr:MAG: hypothetical protein COA67_02220 [Lutibacter sp.]